MQNSVKLGTLDMTNAGCGVTAGSLPEYNITTFYYVWKSPEHMRAFFNSDLCKGFNQKYLDTTGIRILASNWEQGDRQTLSKRPVRKVDDLKGLKMLLLHVTDAGDGMSFDHANWADAQITYTGAAPETLVAPGEDAVILTPAPGPQPRARPGPAPQPPRRWTLGPIATVRFPSG